MSTVDGADCWLFWSTKTVDAFEGALFHLTPFMSRRRFEKILNNLRYTKEEALEFCDHFWEVRLMIKMWNDNMRANFLPSWINCIDESMLKWINEYTCPGFMYVPRKPWPFGNEYHDAGCADSDIIWALDLREGKDWQQNLGKKEFDEIGKTTGILLRLTKPFWSTGKVFVLDSGFCVLQAIVELKKRGLFAAALIKKCRYWPKHVPGNEIIAHFNDKEVGAVDAINGRRYIPYSWNERARLYYDVYDNIWDNTQDGRNEEAPLQDKWGEEDDTFPISRDCQQSLQVL